MLKPLLTLAISLTFCSQISFAKENMNNKIYQENIQKLTELQKFVTQQNGTEAPFKNEFWDNKKEGIYVDAVSGKALFSSKDKHLKKGLLLPRQYMPAPRVARYCPII